MTWNHKGGQKDTSYCRYFCPFFLQPIFPPFFSFKYQLRQDSCMGESLISTSSRPVKPEAYSSRDRTWHFGFQKPLFLYEPRQKNDTERGGGRKKIQGGLGFLRAWSRKAVRKGLLWSLNHSIEWEKFQGISNGLAKILKPLQRSAGEQCVSSWRKREKHREGKEDNIPYRSELTSPQVVLVCMWFLREHEIPLKCSSPF